MRTARDIAVLLLIVAATLALLESAIFFVAARQAADSATQLEEILGQIGHTLPALLDQHASAIRQESLALLEKQGNAIRHDAVSEIRKTRRQLDARLTDIGGDVDDLLLGGVEALQNAAAIRQDLQPTLKAIPPAIDELRLAVKDGQDSWDDLYFDVKASVESVTVAAAAIGRAAPDIAQGSKATSDHFERMAAAGEKWVGTLTAPKSKRTAFLTGMERIGIIGLRAWLLL